jgi:para-nitrobenzyl esterase
MLPKEAAAEMTAITLRELNIAAKDWKKLLDLSTDDLLAVQQKMPSLMAESEYTKKSGIVGFVPGAFSPVVDGVALPHHPFDPTASAFSKNKPLITGWNEDEFTFFAMAFSDTSALKATLLLMRSPESLKSSLETIRKQLLILTVKQCLIHRHHNCGWLLNQ